MHSVLLCVWSCFTAKAALEDEATQDHVNEVRTQSSEVGDVATATELPIGLTEARSPPEDGQPRPPFHAGSTFLSKQVSQNHSCSEEVNSWS